jgi:septum formation protein
MQLVLASTSPRRRELLALLGVSFEVCSPACEEQPIAGLPPREQVARFAMEKAQSVSVARRDDIVMGADTLIELDGTLLGKPVDIAQARLMLSSLAGREHTVHTAVALCCRRKGIGVVEVATALVVMRPDTSQAMTRYLATGESLGKAGAYSIQGQGGDLIERIEGDFTTVVGLPLRLVARLLQSAGHPVPQDVEALYQQRPYPNWARFASLPKR